MSIFTDMHITFEGVEYTYTLNMHNKLNKLADLFYTQQGDYVSRPKFDYFNAVHQSERLMYDMALTAFIFTKKIKPNI